STPQLRNAQLPINSQRPNSQNAQVPTPNSQLPRQVGSCAAWELRRLGVAPLGSCAAWEFRSLGVAPLSLVFGSCVVGNCVAWGLRRLGVAPLGSCAAWEFRSLGVAQLGSCAA